MHTNKHFSNLWPKTVHKINYEVLKHIISVKYHLVLILVKSLKQIKTLWNLSITKFHYGIHHKYHSCDQEILWNKAFYIVWFKKIAQIYTVCGWVAYRDEGQS